MKRAFPRASRAPHFVLEDRIPSPLTQFRISPTAWKGALCPPPPPRVREHQKLFVRVAIILSDLGQEEVKSGEDSSIKAAPREVTKTPAGTGTARASQGQGCGDGRVRGCCG